MANYIAADAIQFSFSGSLAEAVVASLVGDSNIPLAAGATEVVIYQDITNPATQPVAAVIGEWNPVATGDPIILDVVVPTGSVTIQPGDTERVAFTVKFQDIGGAPKSASLRIEANADAVTA